MNKVHIHIHKAPVKDANPDGTISPDEDKQMAVLLDKARKYRTELEGEARKIGGSFRGPGYWAQVKKVLS